MLKGIRVASTSNGSPSAALPRVMQPALWHSIIPKSFRDKSKLRTAYRSQKSKQWNPATFYIVMLLLIGSNSIQMLALRNSFADFSRKADAKLTLLKEVLERLHQGEDVDVQAVLGTGDEAKEKEWEEVLQEIEAEDALWPSKQRTKPGQDQPDLIKDAHAGSGLSDATTGTAAEPNASTTELRRPIGFY